MTRPSGKKTASDPFGIAAWALWGYILIAVGRVGELIPGLANLPIAKVAIGIALLAAMAQRRRRKGGPQIQRPLASRSPIVKSGLYLVGLSILSVPLSVYRSASLLYVLKTVIPLVVCFALIMKICSSWRYVRSTLAAVVWSGALLAIVASALYSGGRASVDSSYDTNDLAYVLVTVLPLSVALAVTSRGTARYIFSGAAAVMVICTLLTQSRGGFLGLLSALLYYVVFPLKDGRKESGTRLKILFVSMLASVVVWSVLPSEVKDRISTLMSLESDYNMDADNTTGRVDIWKRNMKATLHRPWGFGINTFPTVDLMNGGKYKAPHNSMVQIAVELGYLGLFWFLLSYFRAWRELRIIQSNVRQSPADAGRRERAICAMSLQAGIIANLVSGFFLSQAYSNLLWVLMACMASMALVCARETHAGEVA